MLPSTPMTGLLPTALPAPSFQSGLKFSRCPPVLVQGLMCSILQGVSTETWWLEAARTAGHPHGKAETPTAAQNLPTAPSLSMILSLSSLRPTRAPAFQAPQVEGTRPKEPKGPRGRNCSNASHFSMRQSQYNKRSSFIPMCHT
jgi:hypothetical protein